MCGAKCIVDKNITEAGKLLCQFGIVFGFARIEARILQNQNATVGQLVGLFQGSIAGWIFSKRHRLAEQL